MNIFKLDGCWRGTFVFVKEKKFMAQKNKLHPTLAPHSDYTCGSDQYIVGFCVFMGFVDSMENVKNITPDISYRLPFCLWPLSLKLGHFFAVVDRHQHLPHSQQDQADAHDGKGDAQDNHGDVGRLGATWHGTERAPWASNTRTPISFIHVICFLH